jgi:hypothetical protein
MLVGQVLAALRARGQATLDASAAHAAGSSPRLPYELEEAVYPVNEGPGERPPLGPGLPPSIHASGVDCWRGLVEVWENQPMSSPSDTPSRVPLLGRSPTETPCHTVIRCDGIEATSWTASGGSGSRSGPTTLRELNSSANALMKLQVCC